MPKRELQHPDWEIADHDEGLVLRLWCPGSTFGSVEIVVTLDEADNLSDALNSGDHLRRMIDSWQAAELVGALRRCMMARDQREQARIDSPGIRDPWSGDEYEDEVRAADDELAAFLNRLLEHVEA